ncbi:hypothetical protein [Roseivivax isoporae]|uniref:Uncharacterized protein n=1 Tax=Roseivivax isoporae LMG 25204 TaxID=1449351 RepID=X7F531_9RHOB|nr:hypothetical protein [Roseivivax isoporae]ETX27169.1 hypothetical protein RISW2_15385 [Roseivivax isoporae LMG 25204]
MELSADLAARAARIDTLLADRLGARKGRLAMRAVRLGRRLPKGVRADLRRIDAALQIAGHPRLSATLDRAALMAAAGRIEAHLKDIDRRDVRKGRLLGVLAVILANVLILTALLVAVLRWRGFV